MLLSDVKIFPLGGVSGVACSFYVLSAVVATVRFDRMVGQKFAVTCMSTCLVHGAKCV